MALATSCLDPRLAALRGPARYCLPADYREQSANFTVDQNRPEGCAYWSPSRIADCARWQHYVYRWARQLIVRRGLGSVLDVGCGICTKLGRHIEPVCREVSGVDQRPALATARRLGTNAMLMPLDLERPEADPLRTYDLIVCADVLEHLLDPDPLVEWIHRACHRDTLVLLSTPERPRERGRACNGSPKREHVREWSQEEFARFVQTRGFQALRHRLLPADDRPLAGVRQGERAFRHGLADRSPLACQAVLCRSLSGQPPAGDA
ncbi:MAG: class I SAM-dependent methyltransferase [Planctomycetota bacterium]